MIPETEKQRVADAIRAAEAKTTGEIYCVVAQQASRYPLVPFAWAALFALMIPLAPVLFADEPAGRIYVIQLVGFVLALAIFSLPRLRRHLVPRGVQHARAHLTAMRQFAAQGLHKSQDRTGVLIFAAQAERYATIVADEGIHGKVAPDTWNGAIDILIAAIKEGRPADGFVGAVERCGAVLAEHFPRPVGSVAPNDLPDKLVEI
jgi:putative membrane protein